MSATAKNVSLLAYSDQGGKPDGVQVIVHKGHAYVGHMHSNGFSVLDVRDPTRPKPLAFVPMPPNTRSHHIQVADDYLLAINGPNIWALAQFQNQSNYFSNTLTESLKNSPVEFTAGLRIYDIRDPAHPREICFMPIPGLGLNRIWWTGGRYAYVAAHMEGYTDHMMAVIDLANPEKPEIAGRWWLPGQWTAGGEETQVPKGKRYAAHHAIIAGDRAYGSWRDGGVTIHDIGDLSKPQLISHTNWSPPFAGGTHTALPLPDRNLLVVADEATSMNCAAGIPHVWILDIRAPERPVTLSTLPTPAEQDFCAKGGKFGPHNLHENRPGSFQSSSLIFATFCNAGLRVYDIADEFRPAEVGYYVPEMPAKLVNSRPNTPNVMQASDLFVDTECRVYVTDPNYGLHILQYEGK